MSIWGHAGQNMANPPLIETLLRSCTAPERMRI